MTIIMASWQPMAKQTTWQFNAGVTKLGPGGQCPAEFSSNLPQHTCLEVWSIPSKSLISCFRCVWLGLELNSAGHRPSRTELGDPWFNVMLTHKVSSLIINLLCRLYDRFMAGYVVLVMSSCHDKDTDRLCCLGNVKLSWQRHWQVMMCWFMSSCHKDISNNVIFALKVT